MKSNSYLSIFRIVMHGRSAGKILLATILSFTFSIAVILCTFGLMDGFDYLLKSGLRHSSGDILITSKRGFFPLDEDIIASVETINPHTIAAVVQTEAFALFEGKSKGVLVRGVDDGPFSKVTGLKVDLSSGGIVLGEELAQQLGVQVGGEIALTLGRGNENASDLPTIKLFPVTGIVKHGIYQKDLRFVYLKRSELAKLLEVGQNINLLMAGIFPTETPLKDLDGIRSAQQHLRTQLDSDYRVRPFWDEYDFLIEAVKVEKLSISLILQLIVVVAVFNIIAFVIFIMEKKAQDFFFLRAVGLSLNQLMRFWLISVLILWSISCVGAYFLSHLFNWSLKNLAIFQVPGEIYVLSELSIRLDYMAHLTVYTVSLLWVIMAAGIGYFRLKRRPIIQGLRQEFN